MKRQLTVDVFVDGSLDFSMPIISIKNELARWKRYSCTVRETLRTRYNKDSRYHVYLYSNEDPTLCLTLIFRYA